jgi:hypothetical protein
MCFTLTGHSNQHRRFSTNYLQFMNSAMVTMCHLHFCTGQKTSNLVRGCIQTYSIKGYHTVVTASVRSQHEQLLDKYSQQVLGLSKQYAKKDSDVSQFLKKMFGLSLLPPTEVRDSFAFEFISNLPNDKRVEQFCDYLLENYVDANSTFPPPVWSVCSASSLRTINACESFHAHFNVLFYRTHPNIFVLVSALQKYRMTSK